METTIETNMMCQLIIQFFTTSVKIDYSGIHVSVDIVIDIIIFFHVVSAFPFSEVLFLL